MGKQAQSNVPLTFACSCGQVQGHLAADACKSGSHLECYCRDCRAAELYFGQPDPLPGAVDILQTTPDMITITQGQDLLGLFRLGPNGLFRWYATCCDTPLFTTLKSPKLPFLGLLVKRLAEPERLGPMIARNAIPQSDGSTKSQGLPRAAITLFSRLIAARLSGRWRETPVFDIATGKPVCEPIIPSKAERDALYR